MPSTQDTAPPPSPQVLDLPRQRDQEGRLFGDLGHRRRALTGGMAYEALNNAAQIEKNFIIVLNDNEMSISRNVGRNVEISQQCPHKEGYAELKKKWNRHFPRSL